MDPDVCPVLLLLQREAEQELHPLVVTTDEIYVSELPVAAPAVFVSRGALEWKISLGRLAFT